MAAFGCHLSNHQAEHQNTGSRYVGARLWRQRLLLTGTNHYNQRQKQKKQTKEAKTNQHQPARDEPAPGLLRKDCLNGISNMQTVLADYPDHRCKVRHRIAI